MSAARIMRSLATVLVLFIGLVVALWLCWLAINLFDAPLTPAAQAMLAAPSDPYPSNGNLYVALAGFDAPTGQSMVAAGQSRIAAYNLANKAGLSADDSAFALSQSRQHDLAVILDSPGWQRLTDDPWGGAKTAGARLDRLLTANRELVQRYRSLHQSHGYFQATQPGTPKPFAVAPPPVQQLFLAQAARAIQSGTRAQQQQALTNLGQDLAMWRAMLDGQGDLSSKMLAATALDVDIHFLGRMVSDPQCDLGFLRGHGQELLAPFPLRDWRIGDAYRWQMRHMAGMLAAVQRTDGARTTGDTVGGSWLGRQWSGVSAQFFKLHATDDLYARMMTRSIALADGDPTTFDSRLQAYRMWFRDNVSDGRPIPALYNPVGRMLLALNPPAERAISRVYDVAADQRLVYLAYQIRKQAIPVAGVATFMRQHPQWSTHPLGGRSFGWDESSGTLAVVPAASGAAGAQWRLRLDPPTTVTGNPPQHPRLCRGDGE